MSRIRRPELTLPDVRVDVTRVAYRSAAWREMWRRIFAAVAEDFGLDETADCTGLGTNELARDRREPRP